MKKILVATLFLFATLFYNSYETNADEMVKIDTSKLNNVNKLEIASEVLNAGSVEYINNDVIYDILPNGIIQKSLKNELESFFPKAEFQFTLNNGQYWTKSYQVGKVQTNFTTGRNDGKVAQRLMYVYI